MPIMVYDEKAKKWVAQSTTLAKNMNVIDSEGRYDSSNVEDCLKEVHRYTEQVDGDLEALTAKFLDHVTNHPGGVGGGGGGGGGGGTAVPTITSTFDQDICEKGEILTIPVFFQTPNVGSGTAYISINNIEVDFQTVNMGNNNLKVGPLTELNNTISIYVKDRSGQASNLLSWKVVCGGLELVLDFDYDRDFSVTDKIEMPFNIISATNDPITVHLTVKYDKYEINGAVGYNSFTFPELGVGIHPVTIYATAGRYQTKPISFNLVIVNAAELYVSTTFTGGEFEYGDLVQVEYRISKLSNELFDVAFYVDEQLVKRSSQQVGKYFWTLNSLTIGIHDLKIEVTGVEGDFASLEWEVSIVEGEYTPIQPVTAGLLAWFDASNRTNHDSDRTTWEDKSGNGVQATLYNFNYYTNGWINDSLLCDGKSYVEIDMTPYANNIENGSTIDILYRVYDMGIPEAVVMDFSDIEIPYKGISINTLQATLTSLTSQGIVSLDIDSEIRLTFMVDRNNKFGKIFINGVLCRAFYLSDTGTGVNKVYENFQHNQKIYFNSKKGTELFGKCEIKQFRVYGRALSDDEVLQNHMADIKDKEKQKELYDFNYNNRSTPVIKMWGQTDGMTETISRELRVKYESPNEELYGQSFDLPYCQVYWQGTSSLTYVLKNYTVYLKDDNRVDYYYNPFRDGANEHIFTLKADYMESSHANNVGISTFVNDCLYDTKNPAQLKNPKIRNTINGFPVLLYINDEFIGVYNFNHDRYSTNSLGYTEDFPKCLSYEITANSDGTAGGFYKWTQDSGMSEQQWYQSDFRCRYPATRAAGDDNFAELKRLVDWVADADDDLFKEQLDQYFNREYLFRYYLNALMFGMVDSLGKNMMLTTFDGMIWYLQFYD